MHWKYTGNKRHGKVAFFTSNIFAVCTLFQSPCLCPNLWPTSHQVIFNLGTDLETSSNEIEGMIFFFKICLVCRSPFWPFSRYVVWPLTVLKWAENWLQPFLKLQLNLYTIPLAIFQNFSFFSWKKSSKQLACLLGIQCYKNRSLLRLTYRQIPKCFVHKYDINRTRYSDWCTYMEHVCNHILELQNKPKSLLQSLSNIFEFQKDFIKVKIDWNTDKISW